MPNGGSDCCGTCWFNSTHEGEVGYFRAAPGAQTRCVIRDLIIENPFWTYCVNHPHHNPDKIELPIGPAYVGADGYPYRRQVWAESPDTEDIRLMLLRLLKGMPERPRAEYPASPKLDEAVIDQLMRFREPRAVPGLKRVCQFDPHAAPEGANPFGRNRALTVARALEALAAIVGDEALPDLASGLEAGLQHGSGAPDYDPEKDSLAVIRYYSVRGLQHCSRAASDELLRRAADDPNKDVAALAKEFLAKKRR
jgi:hypothetical protein